MTITSFSYFILIAAGTIIYYIVPKAGQWIWLLFLSIIFYCMAATPYTIIYLFISTLATWLAVYRVNNPSVKMCASSRAYNKYAVATVTILFLIFLWFILKGTPFILSTKYMLVRLFPSIASLPVLELTAALGMGYYTLQLIGYILDCYWGTVEPQKNILKLFLFTSFFPQLITGPISRYEQLKELYKPHKFAIANIERGAQRILWGVFKKLVLAERVGIIVNGIWDSNGGYGGFYFWVAILLYPVQMYADFSGCMDIVIGTAELFGIKLPENFNNPFFSRTSQEFWQRWHITLGSWAKDYVLYPLLKSNFMVKLNKHLREKVGKKWGKFLAIALGMFVLWMVIGIWHGGYKYVIGVSLWYWVILMMGEALKPHFTEIIVRLNVRTESFSWHLFQSARTYTIYAIGAVFFRASGISQGIYFVRSATAVLLNKQYWNPWIFFNGSVLNLGITHTDINIIIFSITVLIAVAVLREKYGYARNWMEQQSIVFRWAVWIGLFIFILIYGNYGPEYDASVFLYQGF